ncbi:sedoheptulokinase [Neosynchiropus ocellatus]
MRSFILGVDIGTTSVKVVLLEKSSKAIVESQVLPTKSDITDGAGETYMREQDPIRIIGALNRCMSQLSFDKLQHVCGIGVSGQMHGVLFWKGCNRSSEDYFNSEGCSQLITWQDGRCSSSFLSSLPNPQSHLSVATGFGCATIFWYMEHRPEFVKDFEVAGTIQDYVVSVLCGLKDCVMTPQNAASWGFFNCSSHQWNTDILKAAGFPLHLLPRCVPSGGLAGHTCFNWHGIPVGTPVAAALGDLQCAVYSCLSVQTDAVINISTSAQLTFTMPGDFKPADSPEPASTISYFPFFNSSYLAVAASMNGGNVLAAFVSMLSSWILELDAGVELDDCSMYEKLNCLAESQNNSDLRVTPTILAERHAPLSLGQVTNISTSNLSLGHVFRAICHGILGNLSSMMPATRLRQGGVSRIVGSGSALMRNAVLRQELEKVYALPVVYGQDADAAVGVAMVLCDRL